MASLLEENAYNTLDVCDFVSTKFEFWLQIGWWLERHVEGACQMYYS